MDNPAIIIMAAGLGTRFGGLKQITPVDNEGNIILNYTLYDAWNAGFRKVIFVISSSIEQEFKDRIGARSEEYFQVDYVFQDTEKLNSERDLMETREKPWGTGHAIACCHKIINSPFVVVNADDYYGMTALNQMYQFLSSNDRENEAAMIGYRLKNTVTDSGSVARGICSVKNGELIKVVECTKIIKKGNEIFDMDGNNKLISFPVDTIVSMNCWGFPANITEKARNMFVDFMHGLSEEELKDAEFRLPTVIDSLLESKEMNVRVIENDDEWCGITYREDVDHVAKKLQTLRKMGLYNGPFFD